MLAYSILIAYMSITSSLYFCRRSYVFYVIYVIVGVVAINVFLVIDSYPVLGIMLMIAYISFPHQHMWVT